jgi:hypothetical protein
MIQRLCRATVWARGAIPMSERKYAGPLKWFVFPAFDVLMMVVGFRTMFVGIPSIDALFPPVVAWALSLVWGTVAGVCLVGAVFPKLWPLEIGGKIALFIILTLYLIALRAAPGTYDGSKDAVTGFVAGAMLIPTLRLWILGIEERDRKDT